MRAMKASPVPQPPRMTSDEIRLVRQMVYDQGRTPSEVAGILNRGLSSVCRQLEKTRPAKMGRPAALTSKQIDKLVELVEGMVLQAPRNKQIRSFPLCTGSCRRRAMLLFRFSAHGFPITA